MPLGLRLPGKLLQVADIHQQLRRGQPHVQAGEQALAAGDRDRVAAAFRQDAIGVLQATPA